MFSSDILHSWTTLTVALECLWAKWYFTSAGDLEKMMQKKHPAEYFFLCRTILFVEVLVPQFSHALFSLHIKEDISNIGVWENKLK